jgi:hypothetical protein
MSLSATGPTSCHVKGIKSSATLTQLEEIMVDEPAIRVRFAMDQTATSLDNAMHVVEDSLSEELSDLRAREGVTGVFVSPSGIGAGASGPAFEVAIQLWRSFTDDTARLVTLGGWILWLADRVKAKRNSRPMISDSPTLGAVAAAKVHETTNIDGYRLIDCRPLRGNAEFSTDERHMWLATFEHATRGEVLAVFMSPTGIVLGQVVIPHVVHNDGTNYTRRTPEEISTIFRERNHWG